MGALLERLKALWPLLKDRPWAKWVGYPAFYSLAFFAALWITFPSEQLGARLSLEAKKRWDVDLVVGSARPALLAGVVLRDVDWVVGEAPEAPEAPAEDEAAPGGDGAGGGGADAPPAPAGPPTVRIEKAVVKLGLLNALRGRTDVSFDADAFGGELEGRFVDGPEKSITAHLRGIDLAQSPVQSTGLKFEGKLESLDLEVKVPEGDLQKAEGTLTIQGENLVLQGGEVQHFSLPKVDMGTLEGAIDVSGGKAEFTTFQVKGPDLEAKIEGFVRLAERTTASTVSGKIRLKPTDEWWNKNESLKSIANMALPAQKDGYRLINVFGQLAKPSFRPQR